MRCQKEGLMSKRCVVVFLVLSGFYLSLSGGDKWTTQKEEKSTRVCYQTFSEVYCAESSKGGEVDLKNFLSAFLQFSIDNINKGDMKLHAGIVRLMKRSRPEQGDRILKGVYDYLARESKNKGIIISTGKDISSRKTFSPEEQTAQIEAINWPAYITASMEDVKCDPADKATLTIKIVNSTKKEFKAKAFEIEVRVFGGRNDMLSAGTVTTDVSIKAGETGSFPVEIQVTGDMVPDTRYTLHPFIRNIRVKSEETPVTCPENK
jgi:hypothetical protein